MKIHEYVDIKLFIVYLYISGLSIHVAVLLNIKIFV